LPYGPRQKHTKDELEEFSTAVLEGYKNVDGDQRDKQCDAKKRRDTERLSKDWPSTPAIKHAVLYNLCELYHTAQDYDGSARH